MQWVRLLHQRSSRKKKKRLLDEKKKKNLSETGVEELVSRHPFWCATWLRLGQKGPRSRHEIHVVTWEKFFFFFEVAT